MRNLQRWNLDVLPDDADPAHAFIVGIPSPFGVYSTMTDRKKVKIEMERQMYLAADDIAEEAASVNQYEAGGFDPADLLRASPSEI